MPVDPTSFRTDHQLETPASRVDLPIASPEFYRDLQVPKTVLQDLRLLSQFFSSQGAKLHSLEYTEKIKSLSGEIPEFDEIREEIESLQPVELQEEQALGSLYEEIQRALNKGGKGIGIQSAGDLNNLIERAQDYVSNRGATPGADVPVGDLDIFDQVFMTEINEQKGKRDEEYQKILTIASVDPETAVLAAVFTMAYRTTDYYGEKLKKAMEVYRNQIDQLDQSTARMDLTGASTAEIAKANAELSKNTSYMGIASFGIQSLKQKLDQVDNMTQSILGSLQETQKQIIANFRG
ncbi:MAG: hypothetical protein HYT76_05960 [Deltaproteobacteria bacterium]|nr:hypothetical protein [Deltaproteobacteria bacterium]